MGCSQSKETTDMATPLPDVAPKKEAGKTPFVPAASVNPKVASKNLLAQPGLQEVAKAGNKAMQTGAHHLRNVFATPLELMDLALYKPPVHPKSSEESDFIRTALKHNFVFESLTERELTPLIAAFETINVPAKSVIIKQGDEGDYFYIIIKGSCYFTVSHKVVGAPAGPGASFGELALLYTCPRAATVTASEDMQLFRVDQKSFRYILQNQTQQSEKHKKELLATVSFLKDLTPWDMAKLAGVMMPRTFETGDVIMKKGEIGDAFYIVDDGELMATEVGTGDTKYEDTRLTKGDHFGERALVTGEPRAATITAQSKGTLFVIDKDTFHAVLGGLNELILKSLDKTKLSAIKIIRESHLNSPTVESLANLIIDKDYKAGSTIVTEGAQTEAALYLIRKGRVEVADRSGNRKEVCLAAGYFGDEMLLADQESDKNEPGDPTSVQAAYTATAIEDCTCGVLYLARCRTVLDTRYIGKTQENRVDEQLTDDIRMSDLKKHKLLGAGTFGQVWLVSRGKDAFALKVQSKFELVRDGQANAVVYEKNVMAKLHHPFLASLKAAFQDNDFVYMLMDLVQGGELYNVIHTRKKDGIGEKDAKFYCAGMIAGLAHMHNRGYCHRDIKPENVLISDAGYPILIDFGFAKYVSDKTYTLCGTPLYLAPEVILNRGHSFGYDHWSVGILTFEMITGYTPFYIDGMDQMELFRAIVKGVFIMPNNISIEATTLLQGMITRSPTKRLGSLAGGEADLFEHEWFSDIDFGKLQSLEIKAPLIPKIANPLDGSNFSNWDHLDDKLMQKYPKLSAAEAAPFKEF